MRYFIYRNSTVEPMFANLEATYSGYGDISMVPSDVETYIWAYFVPFKSDEMILVHEINAFIQYLNLLLTQIPTHKNIYALTLYPLHCCLTENGSFLLADVIHRYNQTLYDLSERQSNLKVLDFASFCQVYPKQMLIDWKFYYLSQMQLNPKLATDFQMWYQQKVDAIVGKRKKCLVLDLDNTLWGGILGEDGIDGIQIGNVYPGNAFLDFQQNILALSKRGVILTVCSKNNESDVLDVWAKNTYIAIKKEQLAAWRINWNNKADNIKELAEELNIGLDSIVFVDDNPSERELIKQMLPMVEVPDFPQKPYMLPAFFTEISDKYFQVYSLTDEDKNKLEQYKTNAERAVFQKSFLSFEDYLRSLEIELSIKRADEITIPRIAQMTQKTNQFNLTTKRYTDTDIVDFINNGACVYSLNVKDKFGDSGITGVAIVTIDTKTKAHFDSLLLSCRILGKGIENVFLTCIMNDLKKAGYQTITATYIPTQKNVQVQTFYDKNGFELLKITNNGEQHYCCDLNNVSLEIGDWYKLK